MRWCIPLLLLMTSYGHVHGQKIIKRADEQPGTDPFYFPAKDSSLPEKIVAFAQTLTGTRYQFGCASPATGFDCSGFITYVFNHFNITVPRSSVDFTHEGKAITVADAMPGDLILFTGTASGAKAVGHIGIIVSNDETGITFIHSSSGNEYSVTTTHLNEYYMGRFVSIRRLIAP